MQESINLIPQEERVEQTKTKVVKLSTILSVIFLLFIGGVGGYLYYKVQTVKNDTELWTLRWVAFARKLQDILKLR